jgi:TFIIF-interacting CTD phosphatase-like protein
MAKFYEIVIFTASMSKYADPLIDILDKDRVCSFRLFRESCSLLNGFYVKELKRLNRNMKNVIIVDVIYL